MKIIDHFNNEQITTLFFVSFIFLTSLLKAQTVIIDIKTFLEGPYNSGVMTTTLNGQLPLSQPFTEAPWSYLGTESVTSIPADVVDWVLVELRNKDDNTQIVKKQAAFILNSGHVVDLDGISPVGFDVRNNDYYVAIHHRNHLSILSSTIAYSSTCPGTPTVDYGGKIYNTVQIGTQCWLKENLNIGTLVAAVGGFQSDNNEIEKYCYGTDFGTDETRCDTHGGLYTWDEAMQYSTAEGAQGICPPNWHIPTLAELTTLVSAVGGSSIGGNALLLPTLGVSGTNTSGFSALLTGIYGGFEGTFSLESDFTYFWSSTATGVDAYSLGLYNNDSNIYLEESVKYRGYSVRCIKD